MLCRLQSVTLTGIQWECARLRIALIGLSEHMVLLTPLQRVIVIGCGILVVIAAILVGTIPKDGAS